MFYLDALRDSLLSAHHESQQYAKGGRVDEDDPTIIVHLNKEEQSALDALQGFVNIDPNTNRRDYSPLKPLINNDFYKEIFEMAIGQLKDPKEYPEEEEGKRLRLPHKSIPGEDSRPERMLDDLGTDGDDTWSLMPVSVANFLDKSIGGKRINPNTGFRMYGGGAPSRSSGGNFGNYNAGTSFSGGRQSSSGGRNFSSQTSPLGPQVRAPSAAPYRGADITGRLNATQAPYSTSTSFGGSRGPTFSQPGPRGEMVAGRIYPGDMFGKTKTYQAQPGGGASSSNSPLSLSNVLGTVLTTLGGFFGGIPGASMANMMYTAFSGGTGPEALRAGANTAIGSLLPSPLGEAAQYADQKYDLWGGLGDLLGLGANIGMQYYADKKSKQAQREADREYDRRQKEHESRVAQRRSELGLDTPLSQRATLHEYVYEPQDLEHVLKHGASFKRTGKKQEFKQGGAVRGITSFNGKGDGQSDSISTNLTTGDWIADSDFVSKVGDGDTNSGRRRLKKELKEIAISTPQIYRNSQNAPAQIVKAKTSTGEDGISRELVIRLGGGSLDRGTQRLEELRKNVRYHKNKQTNGIPPKSFPIDHYMPELR